jgi:hypothetical protein
MEGMMGFVYHIIMSLTLIGFPAAKAHVPYNPNISLRVFAALSRLVCA